jgi:hypothetical protein
MSSPKRKRASVGALALLALVAIGLLFFLGDRGPSKKTSEPAASDTASAPVVGGPRFGNRNAQGGASSQPGAGGDVADAEPAASALSGPTNLPPGPSPYPPGSQPLTEGVDPATHPKDTVPISPGDGISCIWGPRVAIVHPDDPMVIDLEVHNNLDALMPIGQGVARFRPDRTDAKEGPWYEAPFVDDGTGKDLAGADRKYTATFQPNADQRAAIFKGGSHVFVEVFFEAPNGLGPRRFPTVMEYSRRPNASLNGKYSDDVVGGSLVVNAGVKADKAGDYRVIASLYAAGTQTAIAFASKTAHLESGDGNVPLLFFGKILYDKGVDGPYELRYVMLFEEILGVDSIAGDTVDHAYTTRSYRARNFSAGSYEAPAPTFAHVDRNSPSQQGKPPPLLGDDLAPGSSGTKPIPSTGTIAAPTPTSSAK